VTQVAYDADQSYIKDISTGDYLLTTDIIPEKITGDNQTVQAAALTSTVASTPVTGLTVVKGATDVEGVGVVLTAAEAGAISVRQMAIRAYVNSTSELFPALGEDTSPKGEVIKASLWDGSTKLSEKNLTNTSGDHDYGAATFDNLSVSVPAGQTKKLVVKFDVDASSPARWVAIGVPASGISAYDSEGNSVDATGDVNLVTAGTEPNRYVIIAAAGGLTMAKDSSSPDTAIVLAGTSDVVMSKIKFTATSENWIVDKLRVALATVDNEGSVSKIKIAYPGGSAQGDLAGGYVTFTGLNWLIEKDTEEILTISADLAAIDPNVATTGRNLAMGVDCATAGYCKANGSSTTVLGDEDDKLSDVDGNAMYLRKSKPTVAAADLPSTSLLAGTKTVSKFTISADSKGPITLKKFSWDVNVEDMDNGGELSVSKWKIYESGNPSTAIASYWSNGATTSTDGAVPSLADGADVLMVEFDSEIEIAAGASKTFTLQGVVAGAEQYDSISTSLLNDDNDTAIRTGGLADSALECVLIDEGAANASVDFLWSDKARGVNHAATMQDTYKDWTNGYLIEVLPTSTSSLIYPS